MYYLLLEMLQGAGCRVQCAGCWSLSTDTITVPIRFAPGISASPQITNTDYPAPITSTQYYHPVQFYLYCDYNSLVIIYPV